MPADIYPGVAAALTDMFSVAGLDFFWMGNPYHCVLNADRQALVTSKAFFPPSGFPMQGDKIRIGNKDYQVEQIANADLEFVAGGLAGDRAFVDDPNNPSIIISFNSFIGK